MMAPTGQTLAQDGSSQCRHMRRTNLSPRGSTVVKAVAESVGSGSPGWLCPVLQAAAHGRQPMHLVMSINSALDCLLICSLHTAHFVHLGSKTRATQAR